MLLSVSVPSNATFQGLQLPYGPLMASQMLKNPLFHNEDIFQFLIQYSFKKCFLGFEIQVFTKFLPVCWQRILPSYSSWQLIFVYFYAAIFYLMNMIPLENIIFSHYVFSINSTENQLYWYLYQKKIYHNLCFTWRDFFAVQI